MKSVKNEIDYEEVMYYSINILTYNLIWDLLVRNSNCFLVCNLIRNSIYTTLKNKTL